MLAADARGLLRRDVREPELRVRTPGLVAHRDGVRDRAPVGRQGDFLHRPELGEVGALQETLRLSGGRGACNTGPRKQQRLEDEYQRSARAHGRYCSSEDRATDV